MAMGISLHRIWDIEVSPETAGRRRTGPELAQCVIAVKALPACRGLQAGIEGSPLGRHGGGSRRRFLPGKGQNQTSSGLRVTEA